MSYLTQSAIAMNTAMVNRVSQCAASEGIVNYDVWTSQTRRVWAAAPGWDTAWESALETYKNQPTYDPGSDETVITDGMILSQVQAMPVTAPTTGPSGMP